MKYCYVIFYIDGDVAYVTFDDIEKHAEEQGMNVQYTGTMAGRLCRKDGVEYCRTFVEVQVR